MQAQTIDTRETDFKFAAFMDARARSYAASTHYSQAERNAAERIRLVLDLVYSARTIYVTYRKKFINVKVEAGLVRDRRQLAALEQDFEQRGITKLVSAQGIIYRIPKANA